jgi:hypothetical protein
MHNTFCTTKPSLVELPIFIDGISRTGKFLLGKIVSCFNDVENFQYISLIEQILYIHKLGSITRDAAIAFIKAQIDEHAYNMYLGRNLNLRFDDATSLYNNFELNKYLKRSLVPYGLEQKKEILNNKSESLFILHESFSHIELLYGAFPKMKFIHLNRHPVDLVHSWFINVGNRFKSDPFSFIPIVQSNNNLMPWYAVDWKDEFVPLTNIDRIIKSISYLLDIEKNTYTSLTKHIKALILEIKYEDIVENTSDAIDSLSMFLDKDPHDQINYILAKEKCPNKISLTKRGNKLKEIKKVASDKYINLLDEMIINYVNN